MKISYSGAANGAGAVFDWDSRQGSKGRIEITEASAPSRVRCISIVKPFAADNMAEFAIVPESSATQVTWTPTGRNAYFCKMVGTIFNMDKMVGSEFTKGLGNLRALAEH